MLRFSPGNEHCPRNTGRLRASLAGDRARGGASGCPEMFLNAHSVNDPISACSEVDVALDGLIEIDIQLGVF